MADQSALALAQERAADRWERVQGFGGFTYDVCRHCRYARPHCRCHSHDEELARLRDENALLRRSLEMLAKQTSDPGPHSGDTGQERAVLRERNRIADVAEQTAWTMYYLGDKAGHETLRQFAHFLKSSTKVAVE